MGFLGRGEGIGTEEEEGSKLAAFPGASLLIFAISASIASEESLIEVEEASAEEEGAMAEAEEEASDVCADSGSPPPTPASDGEGDEGTDDLKGFKGDGEGELTMSDED